ncbi:response regulator [Polaromonas sp. P2-4]|nr:response regulator [Polaromonas sp. P2-4]
MGTPNTPSPSSPAKILIVEDSPTQAQRLRHILEDQDYEVRIASDGRIALEIAPQFQPAVIISDIVMPEVDGYELTRRIKADPDLRGIPVILVTNMSDPQDVIRGLECGADNFVLKPYDERYLLSRVQYVLINRELRQAKDATMGVEVDFDGQRHYVTADRLQILNLLLSTYAAAVQRNKELSESQAALEQRSAELMSANYFLDSIIENIPNAITMKDAVDLRFVRINRAGEKLMGYSREELLGKSVHDFFPKEEADAFSAKDREVLAHGKVEDILEEPIHTHDKGLRILHTKKVPVFDEYGQPSHVLGISEDVTEQRKMEQGNSTPEHRVGRMGISPRSQQQGTGKLRLLGVA